jgi:hypothetical protein
MNINNAMLGNFSFASQNVRSLNISTKNDITCEKIMSVTQCRCDFIIVPYHGGGRSKKINAWYLNTHMVFCYKSIINVSPAIRQMLHVFTVFVSTKMPFYVKLTHIVHLDCSLKCTTIT